MRRLASVALLWSALASSFSAHGQNSGTNDTKLRSQQTEPLAQSPNQHSADCLAMGDTADKERCFATSADFTSCPKSDLRCSPYKRMHALENELRQKNESFVKAAEARFRAYESNDAAYVADLIDYFRQSDSAWHTFRDSNCLMEQFAQGMSREASSDLAESCRATMTQQRIDEIKTLTDALQ